MSRAGSMVVEQLGRVQPTWQEIDRGLRTLAKRRGAIDADEAILLCHAVRLEVWCHLGKASLLEYLEDVLGYTPKLARDRVRVAFALDEMPDLAVALATGELSYSVIREVTRVATAETQAEWCAAVRGKNVRQVEDMVAGRKRGDRPTDPADPDLKPRIVRFEVTTATYARLRQVQQLLAEEHGFQLDDDALVSTMCAAILDGEGAHADQGRARHQVMTTICEACGEGWQLAAGREVAISATDVAIAECDAQRIGSDREPGKATQDVAPRVRRFIMRRDHGKCVLPECRSSRNVDVHHIVPRFAGGGHGADNLTVLCSGHHRAHHDGLLTITPELVAEWRRTAHVGHAVVRHEAPQNKSRAEKAAAIDRPLPPEKEPGTTAHVGRGEHASARHELVAAGTMIRAQKSTAIDAPAKPTTPVTAIGVTTAARTAHVGHASGSRYAQAVLRVDAVEGLAHLGFSRPLAKQLVELALVGAPPDLTLEQLLREALRRSREA